MGHQLFEQAGLINNSLMRMMNMPESSASRRLQVEGR
jgi:hypothetical protein